MSSARVLSFSLEKFWLGKVVAQYRLSAARTVEAMWMFPADILAVFHISCGQEYEAKGNPFTETMCNFLF